MDLFPFFTLLPSAYLWHENRALRRVLRQYAGREIARAAPALPETATGYRTNAAVCFADIPGFTAASENMKPEAVACTLQKIFAPALEQIRESGGVVDKIQGDGFLFRFASPFVALDAVSGILETMQKGVKKALPGCPAGISLGMHYGPVFQGMIGTPGGHVDYSVFGDAVNVASRIQNLCRTYSVPVLVTGDVWREAGQPLGWRLLDACRVFGRQESLDLFAPEHIASPEAWAEFESARDLYAAGQFSAAAQAFTLCSFPGAPLWADRCRHLSANPPAFGEASGHSKLRKEYNRKGWRPCPPIYPLLSVPVRYGLS